MKIMAFITNLFKQTLLNLMINIFSVLILNFGHQNSTFFAQEIFLVRAVKKLIQIYGLKKFAKLKLDINNTKTFRVIKIKINYILKN